MRNQTIFFSFSKSFCFLTFFAFGLFISASSNAQEYSLDWLLTKGGSGYDEANSLARDVEGNWLYAGRFSGTANFGSTTNPINRVSNGLDDAFVTKISSTGEHIWTATYGSTDSDNAKSLVCSSDSSVYIVGSFYDEVDFDPGDSIELRSPIGNDDFYILKLDKNGAFIYVNTFGSINRDRALKVQLDNSENLVIVGYISGPVDFDPSNNSTILQPNSNDCGFVAKYTPDGNLIWAQRFDGTNSSNCNDVCIGENDRIYVTGYFRNTIDLDPSSILDLFHADSSFNGSDAFVVALNSNGTYQWGRTWGAEFQDVGWAITQNDNGVFIGGLYEKTVKFEPSNSSSVRTSNGSYDMYILELSHNGQYVDVKTFGGIGVDVIYALDSDTGKNIYFAGYFNDSLLVEIGSNSKQLYSATGDAAIIGKYSEQNNLSWMYSTEGSVYERILDIQNVDDTTIMASGLYQGVVNFQPGTTQSTRTSNGDKDLFVLGVDYCNNINTQVTQSGSTLMASVTNQNYQWLDCGNNYVAILGQTGQIFAPTINGSYAVKISNGSCTDTSTCIEVSSVGVPNIETSFVSDVYPNPTDRLITLSLNEISSEIIIRITNEHGQLVTELKRDHVKDFQVEMPDELGIYFIEVITSNHESQFHSKIVRL